MFSGSHKKIYLVLLLITNYIYSSSENVKKNAKIKIAQFPDGFRFKAFEICFLGLDP